MVIYVDLYVNGLGLCMFFEVCYVDLDRVLKRSWFV